MANNFAVAQFVYKYPTDKDIFPNDYVPAEDICKRLNGVIKTVAVQAPQGTKIYINENSEAIIGPAGIFELDNILDITSFKLQGDDYLNKVIIDVIYNRKDE